MLNTTPEPEEFLSAPTALPDPPGEDHASNDGSTGGLIPLNFTSDGDSSMDIEMYQFHIQTTNSLLQGMLFLMHQLIFSHVIKVRHEKTLYIVPFFELFTLPHLFLPDSYWTPRFLLDLTGTPANFILADDHTNLASQSYWSPRKFLLESLGIADS